MSTYIAICIALITALVPYTYYSKRRIAKTLKIAKTLLDRVRIKPKEKDRIMVCLATRNTRGLLPTSLLCGLTIFIPCYFESYVVALLMYLVMHLGILFPLALRCVNLKLFTTSIFLVTLTAAITAALQLDTEVPVALMLPVIWLLVFKGFLIEYGVYRLLHTIYRPLGFRYSASIDIASVMYVKRN